MFLSRRVQAQKSRDVTPKMTLDQVKPGKKVVVAEVAGGWEASGRLMSLGIGPGVELEVVSIHPFKGPVVVRLEGTQVALGRGIAKKIAVDEPKIAGKSGS